MAQQGAIAAYRTKDEWRPRVLTASRRHQDRLLECVTAIDGLRPIVYPAAGNFLAIDVSGTGVDAEAVVKAVLDRGIVIRSGGYTSANSGNRFIRVTATVPEEHIERFCSVFPEAVAAARA